MTAATAVAWLLGEAARYLAVREVPVGSNRGTAIDYFVGECGLDPKGGYPWCAAFVGQVGRQAVGRAWPCPRTASVAALAAWAQAVPAERWFTDPAAGDLFVAWHADLKRFAHVGIVDLVLVAAGDRRIRTVEGNANPGGGREGFGVFALNRAVPASMRFIRWTAALKEDL